MGDYLFSRLSDRSRATAADTDGGGVTATIADPGDGYKLVCTGIQCSSDAAAIVTIESPASTILWRKRFSAAFTMSEAFPLGFIEGASSEALLVKVSAATANSEANIQAARVTG